MSTGVFLAGWEYNRLLQDDPFTPRNSALPGDLLWHGAFQLWMFENVFCTKESLENEVAGSEILGWTSGKVFKQLAKDGFLTPVDWTRLRSDTKEEIRSVHAELRPKDPREVRVWIEQRDVVKLESAKTALLALILAEKNCVLGYAPNSLKNWQASDIAALPNQILLKQLLTQIAEPVHERIRGLRICRPPSTVPLSREDKARMTEAHQAETDRINDLVAGEGDYSGPVGYLPYLRTLESYRPVYQTIDIQLAREWEESRIALNRLRDAAKRHLWRPLHNEWIPELKEKGVPFVLEFRQRVAKALRRRHFADLFNMDTRLVAMAVGSTIGGGIAYLQGELTSLHPSLGLWVAVLADNILKRASQKYGSLALFYQEALSGRGGQRSDARSNR